MEIITARAIKRTINWNKYQSEFNSNLYTAKPVSKSVDYGLRMKQPRQDTLQMWK